MQPDLNAPTIRPDGTAVSRTAVPSKGDIVGHYIILEAIGEGAWGLVFAAYDSALDRKVAIKLLRSEGHDEEARARLHREGQALAKLSHPNVVTVYEVGTHGDQIFIAMELVDGVTLREWREAARRSPSEIVAQYIAAGRGLEAAHAANVVHRDFKPGNVMVGQDGRVRVVDFGLARTDGDAEERGPERELPSTDPSLTQHGTVVGTPAYMAPEQHRGEVADVRSDIYSFCVSLHEALAGRHPFSDDDGAFDPQRARQSKRPLLARGSGLDRAAARAVARGMSIDPGDRIESLARLLNILDSSRRRPRRALALAGVAAVAGAVLLVQSRQPDETPCPDQAPRVAAAFSDDTRAELARRFGDSKAQFARRIWAGAEAGMTDFLKSWRTGWERACRATRVDRVQSDDLLDRRFVCLERRYREATALIALWRDADDDVIRSAARAVQGLSPTQDCADPDWLLASSDRPSDPAVAAIAEEIDEQLIKAKAAFLVGKRESSFELARAGYDRAGEVEFLPIRARAAARIGHAALWLGRVDVAERHLDEAVEWGLESGDVESAIRGWDLLVYVHGVLRKQPEQGHRAARRALALLNARDIDGSLRGGVRGRQAYLLMTEGRHAMAIDAQREALTHYENALGEDHADVGIASNFLAVTLHEGGFYRRAGERAERAAEILGRFNPLAPEVGRSHLIAAEAHLRRGDVERAEQAVLRAESVFSHLETDSWGLAGTAADLHGEIVAARGDLEAALTKQRQAVDKYGSADQVLGNLEVVANDNLTRRLLELGRLRDAEEQHSRSREIAKARASADSKTTARLLETSGRLQLARGDMAAARRQFAAALGSLESTYREDHPALVPVLAQLAAIDHQLGGHELETAAAQRIVEIARSGDAHPSSVAMARSALARHP